MLVIDFNSIKTVLKPFKIKHDIFISAILISR